MNSSPRSTSRSSRRASSRPPRALAARATGRRSPLGSLGALLSALTVLFLLTGCASTGADGVSKIAEYRDQKLNREVRSLGFEPEELIKPYRLTPEMREWVHTVVPATGSSKERLIILLDYLLDEDGEALGVRYDSGFTPTASEVFDSRLANCLSFTHLFVGLAREAGMDAYYLDVNHAETFERDQDLIVLSGHVTAGYGVPTDPLVLEYSVGPDADYRYVTKLEDRRALAMYYSNRGAEEMRHGNLEQSVEWLRTAVTLDHELPDAWVNYGVVLRRMGDQEAAEEAYRKALQVNPQTISAYQNLATLMRLQGRSTEADELVRVAQRLGDRNPFNYLNLGDLNLRRGEIEAAETYYRKALSLYGELAEPYAAMGILAYHLDRPQEARKWLRRAEKRDPENPRTRALARRLDAAERGDEGMARIVQPKGERG
ncbi:MAG: tetratricopeptide repeat protein [Acidobacteriota bacterium]|nr:tetratricopeptide repeat protein [Acidobacteriota bacterium]